MVRYGTKWPFSDLSGPLKPTSIGHPGGYQGARTGNQRRWPQALRFHRHEITVSIGLML
jgi:hypothetical protein